MDSTKEGNLCCPGLDTEIRSIWTIKLILEEIKSTALSPGSLRFSEEIGWHVLSQRSFYGVVPASNEATPRLRQCAAKTFIDESPCLQCTQLAHH